MSLQLIVEPEADQFNLTVLDAVVFVPNYKKSTVSFKVTKAMEDLS